ncbi:MAG: energy-coupling factor transporter ATPase [Clostridia bacterium]|nr:energy-coupling factor transporter ATPase [Clostridia bacterium]
MGKLEIRDVSYIYGKDTPFEKLALDRVNAEFCDNCITGLIGHTGCGKSTLVQLLNGLLVPTQGKVFLDGQDINAKSVNRRELRFRVGLVFQYPEYQLFEETVQADIAFGPKNMGLDSEETARRVLSALHFVGLDETLLTVSPFDLSGGQKRRVAIAGVMAMQPEVLILDEPAAGLDPIGREEILGGIKSYQRARNSSVIIVSHSMEDMARYSDNIVVMSHGTVTAQGTCRDIFSNHELLTDAGLSIPQVTAFLAALRKNGIDVSKDIFTVDDAVKEIRSYMLRERNRA